MSYVPLQEITVKQGTATNLKAQAEAYQGAAAVGTGNPLQVSLANTAANATAVKVSGAVTASVADGLGVKIYDTGTASYVGLKFNAEAPQVCAQDYLQAVAEGDITGHSPFEKFGRVTGVTTATVGVWDVGTTFNWPAAATKMDVTGGAQDLVGGTGVEKIKIEGLNGSYAVVTEEVTMTGAVIVTTTNTFLRINRAWASQVGANGVASANIDIKGTGGATVYGRIPSGLTQSRSARYTVPTGKTLYVTSFYAFSGVGNTGAASKFNFVTVTLRAKVDPASLAVSTIWYPHAEVGVINGSGGRPFEMPLKIPATADLAVDCYGDTAQAVTVQAVIRGWTE